MSQCDRAKPGHLAWPLPVKKRTPRLDVEHKVGGVARGEQRALPTHHLVARAPVVHDVRHPVPPKRARHTRKKTASRKGESDKRCKHNTLSRLLSAPLLKV